VIEPELPSNLPADEPDDTPGVSSAPRPLLDVRDLSVSFATTGGAVQAVDGVSFVLARGEVLALVGESGSGKSVCAMTLMGLTRGPNTTIAGEALLEDEELIGASEAKLRRIRGARLAMVFQDPQSSLNPVHRVGDQIAEQIRAHTLKGTGEPFVSKAQALERAAELMERVEIPRARERVRAYPHELSGGMRQRVMIAMALSLGAKALLADEPTTALDVTVQAQILSQLKQLRDEEGLGIVLITHDFGVVAETADRIAVMQAGRIVEQGGVNEVLTEPEHPYTRGLLEALQPFRMRRAARARFAPSSPTDAPAPPDEPPSLSDPAGVEEAQRSISPRLPVGERLLVVEDLRVSYPVRGRRAAPVEALAGVSLRVGAGETLAIVGESGCGKTTLLRSIARLVRPSSGAILLDGQDLPRASRRALATLRREMGVVFQDSHASLNPRRRVGDTLARALRARAPARRAFTVNSHTTDSPVHDDDVDRDSDTRPPQGQAGVAMLLERVGLTAAQGSRYPHELSGGQRQRVNIARALAGGPKLVLLDEPVSSLDASLRRGIVELLGELQQEIGCGYVLVSHDLATVEAVADCVAVMSAGRIVEMGQARDVFERPEHPYTQALLAASPKVPSLPGGVRSPGWAHTQTQDHPPCREGSRPQGPPERESSPPTRRSSFGA
jgi:peptide/nickel transport system ATP-binding protein